MKKNPKKVSVYSGSTEAGASALELRMLFKESDLICVLNDEVEVAKWKNIRRTLQAKETASENLRGLINPALILKA